MTDQPRHRLPARHSSAPRSLLLAVLALLTAGLAGCGKSPEEEKAAAIAKVAQTTGRLAVNSNLPAATIAVTHLPPPGEPAAPLKEGPVGRELSGLRPGHYAVTVTLEGWPELTGTADVTAGQTTAVTMNFKTGSLRLDSEPSGATVKLGATVLGQTPLTVPQLPAGPCELTLVYQQWPALPFKTTLVENQETAETVRLPHGRLTVRSMPAGANVLLGGKTYGPTPLFFERLPAGPVNFVLQSKDFPALPLTATIEDGGEVTVNPELGTGFPLLDPTDLLRAVWAPPDPGRITASFEITGRFAPRNGVVKNLSRKKLHEDWLGRKFRFAAVVKGYDRKDRRIEFVDQNSELSRYRLVAILAPATNDEDLRASTPKGSTVTFYGELTAVEEPRWPSKIITLEFSAVERLQGDPPASL